MRFRRATRSGVSTLGLVVFMVFVIGLIQVQQHLFMGQVSSQAGASVLGRAAHEIGVAAAREARNILGKRLNTPGSAEFQFVRGAPPRDRTPQPVALTAADLVETKSMIEDVYKDIYQLVRVEASLSYMIPLTVVDGGEFEGILAIKVGVGSKIQEGVERLVDRRWVFKVVRVAPVSILQGTQVLIRHPELVLKGRWDVHEITRRYIQDDMPALTREVTAFINEIGELEGKAKDSSQKQQLAMLKGFYTPLVQGGSGGRIGTALQQVQARFSNLPQIPIDADDYVFAYARGDLPITELRLQQDFDDLMESFRTLKERSDQLGEAVKNAKSASSATIQLHRDYAEAIGVLAEKMGESAERYVRFRELFELIARGDSRLDFYHRAHDLLDPVGRLPGLENYPKFDARLCFIINEGLAGDDIQKGFEDLLDRLDREGHGVSGTILVENPTRRLELSGTMKGRWTLGVTGDLGVENLRRADPREDLFTVIHVASSSNSLSLSGQIEATIVSSGSGLTIQPDTTITGGLFLNDVDPRSRIDGGAGGQVVRDPRREIDARRQMHVVISPWTRSLTSGRES